MNQQIDYFDLESPATKQLEYELLRKIGERRFGSGCKHEKTSGGFCVNCLRKVLTK